MINGLFCFTSWTCWPPHTLEAHSNMMSLSVRCRCDFYGEKKRDDLHMIQVWPQFHFSFVHPSILLLLSFLHFSLSLSRSVISPLHPSSPLFVLTHSSLPHPHSLPPFSAQQSDSAFSPTSSLSLMFLTEAITLPPQARSHPTYTSSSALFLNPYSNQLLGHNALCT